MLVTLPLETSLLPALAAIMLLAATLASMMGFYPHIPLEPYTSQNELFLQKFPLVMGFYHSKR